MRANHCDFIKIYNSLYSGVALDEKRLSENAEKIRRYLVEGGAANVGDALGVGFRVYERAGEVYKMEFCFTQGEHRGEALAVDEIRTLGLFLPGGPCRGIIARETAEQEAQA